MTKEFTKISRTNETIYVLESASAGASSTAGGATLSKPMKILQRRETDEVTDRVPQKPRQGPLRQQTGGGAHRDKKKEQKQGKEKHRKPFAEQGVAEGSSKQARAKKEAESVKSAIARLEQELKDPNPHIDKDDIRRRLETEKRRLELYSDVLDEQGVAEGRQNELELEVKHWQQQVKKLQNDPRALKNAEKSLVKAQERLAQSKKGVSEDLRDPDHEISMASNQLLSIIEDAMRLLNIVRKYSEMEGLEAWQQSKLTKAADYLDAVLNNLQGKEVFHKEDHNDYGKGWGQESYNTYAGGNHGRGVAEAGWGRRRSYYNPMDQERREQDAMDAKRSAFKYAELKHELGHEEETPFIVKKHYFMVPFSKKDTAKSLGLRWDPDKRLWYLPEYNTSGRGFDSKFYSAQSAFGDTFEPKSNMEEDKIKGADGKACWKGKRYAGTKNGKDICVPVGEEETQESALMAWAGRRKHGDEYMEKASAAARDGASQEELGRLKDIYSKAEKVKEAEKKGLYYHVNKRKKAGISRPASHPDAPSPQDWKNAAKTARKEDTYSESLINRLEDILQEKAPPGKYERMVKHIKARYSQDGEFTDVEKRKAYGAAWKAKNKAKK